MKQVSIQQRSLQLLKLLVERYVQEGQPVGSKALATELDVSSATARNIMADLEAAGYLKAPHTSAGRVPTLAGYRLFVDYLMTVQPLDETLVDQYKNQLLSAKHGEKQLVQVASNLLSHFTHFAGVVSTPHWRGKQMLTHIEFLKLSEKRVLAVLVFNNTEVENRILQVDRHYTKAELERASQFINQQCANKDVLSVRATLLDALQKDKESLNQMMQVALTMAQQAVEASDAYDYVLAGEANLFDYASTVNIQELRALFEAFTEKQTMLQLLDKSLRADGVQIFIGKESGHAALDHWSVVTAPYTCKGEVVGVLGVIGPTRMAYDKVVSTVDLTAKLLTSALGEG